MSIYERKEYETVDIMKLVCAYMVCILHMPVIVRRGGIYDSINFFFLNYLCRLAVPFFFLCAGFFLFRTYDAEPPQGHNYAQVKNYVLRIARLYGLWLILLFAGDTGHLWYLKALVVSTLLLYLCIRTRLSIKGIIIIAALFYCCGLLLESYHGLMIPYVDSPAVSLFEKLFNTYFGTVKNGLTFGFLFVSIGAYLAKKRPKIRFQGSLIGFFVSMFLLFAEVYLLKKYDLSAGHNLSIFQVPTTVFLFLLCISIPAPVPYKTKHIRATSILIYFTGVLTNLWYFLRPA